MLRRGTSCARGATPETTHSAASASRPARFANVRLPCASPSSPTFTGISMRSKPCSRRSTTERAGRGLVPRRPRRLRAAAESLLRARRRSGRTSASSVTTTSACSVASTWTTSHPRRPRPPAGPPRCSRAEPRALPRVARARRERAGGAALFHASPRDPVWEYVLAPEVALPRSLEATRSRSCSSATAMSRFSSGSEERDARRSAPEGTEIDLARERWLLNPGSVGQPRDGDPRAAWLLLDFEHGARSLPPRRVPDRAHAGGDPRARACPRARCPPGDGLLRESRSRAPRPPARRCNSIGRCLRGRARAAPLPAP